MEEERDGWNFSTFDSWSKIGDSDRKRDSMHRRSDLIIKASQVRRIDAFGLANCGVVNNRDDPAWCCSSPPTVAEKGGRRVVDESGEEGRGSVGKRVECSLNKQIPKRTHYLRLHRVAGYAADA